MTKRNLIGAALVTGLLTAADASAEAHPAELSWTKRVQLGTPLSGTVAKVMVRPGQQVSRGATVLRLDTRALKAQVAAKEALRETRRRESAEAERELERALDLYDRTLLSEHDRLVAENGAARARSSLLAAEAELIDARVRLEQATVRAPFAGQIIGVPGYEGQAVSNRCQITPLAELSTGEISAIAHLTADRANQFQPGARVTISVAGQEFTAEITQLQSSAHPIRQDGNLVSVRAVFTPPSGTRVVGGSTATMTLND